MRLPEMPTLGWFGGSMYMPYMECMGKIVTYIIESFSTVQNGALNRPKPVATSTGAKQVLLAEDLLRHLLHLLSGSNSVGGTFKSSGAGLPHPMCKETSLGKWTSSGSDLDGGAFWLILSNIG